MKKKIAFIFAFPIRTNPVLITMPFGINIITLLDRKGYEIDVYLSEYRSDVYDGLFSDGVQFHFLDHNYMWPKEGYWSFFALTNYFRWVSWFRLRNKYSHIFASGMAGITLGGILKKVNRKSTFIYLNDEFPDQGTNNIWVRSELKTARSADIVSTPDETRFPPLTKQIPSLANKPHYALPNAPLMDELIDIPEIIWHERFNIDSSKKLFLMAGGLQEFNLISELLASVRLWPEDCVLILKGKYDVNGFREKYAEYDIPGRIVWCTDSFSPDMLHSLIKYCSASLCLYRPINDNLRFVAKSSGKLLRSVLLGKPVIVSADGCFEFVEELNIGVITSGNEEGIAKGVRYILDNSSELQKSCINNGKTISFEAYWSELEKAINL